MVACPAANRFPLRREMQWRVFVVDVQGPDMKLKIRRWFNFVEHQVDHGDPAAALRKVAVAAVVENPYAGRRVEDLRPMIAASEALGREMGEALLETLGPY